MRNLLWLKTTAAAFGLGGILISSLPSISAAPPPREGRTVVRERLLAKLGVTPEQKRQIRDVLRNEKEALADLVTRLHSARSALRTTIRQDNSTEGSIRRAAAELAAVQADLAVKRHEILLQLKPILTGEQLERIELLGERLEGLGLQILGGLHEQLERRP